MDNSLSNSSDVSKVLVLGGREIRGLLSMSEALKAVERAFKLKAEGRVIMPPKLYLDLPEYKGDFRAMPSYIDGVAGVKWVSAYPGNPGSNLHSVVATIILCDPNTGYPLAIMDGTYITDMRTGAAGGIAVKYLARKNSTVIGVIGAGAQARTQLMAINEVLPRIEVVRVFDLHGNIARQYAHEMSEELNIDVRPAKTIDEASEADIIVITTPSRKPILKRQHVRPGTHINAIGADAKGKEEIEPDLLRSAKIIVDDIEQASHSGEINVPLSEGLIGVEDIYGTLGEIVAGAKRGRTDNEEITVFDSTGLAIEDMICAKLIYEKTKERQDLALLLLA